MMQTVISLGLAMFIMGYLVSLLAEKRRAIVDRAMLKHVIHVNGTRGKSTVCRLIAAGLRAGGFKVFCKTTGTDPMIIDVNDRQLPIVRHGRANISEQLKIMHRAAGQGSEIFVVECMAIQPPLQRMSQRMLCADVGVITNVRRDHTDVMGSTPEDICDALSNMIPENGVLFTAESYMAGRLEKNAVACDCAFRQIRPDGTEPDFDFSENIALALGVCTYLGVDRDRAIDGMMTYHPDPYALEAYRLGETVVVNGLSANDAQSTIMAYERMKRKYSLAPTRFILLYNNRADRGFRTENMISVCERLKPDEVWLMGAAQHYAAHRIKRRQLCDTVRMIRDPSEIDFSCLDDKTVLYAVGNIADDGRKLITRIRGEGEILV